MSQWEAGEELGHRALQTTSTLKDFILSNGKPIKGFTWESEIIRFAFLTCKWI